VVINGLKDVITEVSEVLYYLALEEYTVLFYIVVELVGSVVE